MSDGVQTQEQRLSAEGSARQQFHFQEFIQAARSGPWERLKVLQQALWARYAEDKLTDGQAGYVAEIITARLQPADKPPPGERPPRSPDSFVGTRPITPASALRRRRASRETFVHPQDTDELTNGEAAVLTIITEEIMKGGRCELPVGKLAALAGISRRWTQHTLSKLAALLFVVVEHRPGERRRHNTNVVTLHPSRGAIKARLDAVKRWWKGRGGLRGIGRTLVRTTRLKSHERHPASRDNSVSWAPAAPLGSAGRRIAKPAPP